MDERIKLTLCSLRIVEHSSILSEYKLNMINLFFVELACDWVLHKTRIVEVEFCWIEGELKGVGQGQAKGESLGEDPKHLILMMIL